MTISRIQSLRRLRAACRQKFLSLLRATVVASTFAIPALWAPGSAEAANYNVTDSATFATAVASAGNGDTITIQNSFTMATQVNPISANVTVIGGGNTINANSQFRPFFVNSGTVTIQNVTIQNGLAKGGDGGIGLAAGGGGLGAGGAIFVNDGATVAISNVTFTDNQAQGGAGGIANGAAGGTGGGGGLGGEGGHNTTGTSFSAGGGGGLYGAGGNSEAGHTGGGGGGGVFAGGVGSGGGGGGGGGGALGAGTDAVLGTGGAGGAGGGANGGDITLNGDSAATFGGGGGGGGSTANGGTGGPGGGGGGAGNGNTNGGTGGDFGGGGGAYVGTGGTGGFGGGGGSGVITGGTGGFGGGGGGGTSGGVGGTGGGSGGTVLGTSGGGGGAAFGGAIFVRQGGTLTINGTSISGGAVAGGAGGNGGATGGSAAGTGLYLNDATLNFNGASNATIDDVIAGTGGVTVSGTGTVSLTGTSTYTGATNVQAGRLAVNGSTTSETTVGANGTLGGTGHIYGDVINNGTVAAGNSIGTLNITGNYTHHANSAMQVEIDNIGNNDVVSVDGTATINGGTVQVLAAPGTYTLGQQYTFLTATGGVSGTFAGVTDNLALFDAQLFYNSNDVGFELVTAAVTYASLGQTANQRSVGAYLDGSSGDPAFNTVANNFLLLSNNQAANGLQQLAGEVFATTPGMMLQNTTLTWQNTMGRLRPQAGTSSYSDDLAFARRDSIQLVSRRSSSTAIPLQSIHDVESGSPGRSGWVMGYGLGGQASGGGNADGITYGLGGTQFGLESMLDDVTTVGVFGGYVGSQVRTNTLVEQNTANSGQVGGYLRRDFGSDYYLVAGGFSFDDYASRREVAIGPLNSTLSGQFTGWQSIAYAERGLTYLTTQSELQPYVALQYIYLRQNGFSETGGVGALDVAGIDANSLRSFVGTRLSSPYVTAGGQLLVPQARVAWLHEFLDTNQISNARFGAFGGGTSFAVQGLDLGRDWALVGAGLTWNISEQVQIAGNYDLQANGQQTFHIGSGSLTYWW